MTTVIAYNSNWMWKSETWSLWNFKRTFDNLMLWKKIERPSCKAKSQIITFLTINAHVNAYPAEVVSKRAILSKLSEVIPKLLIYLESQKFCCIFAIAWNAEVNFAELISLLYRRLFNNYFLGIFLTLKS